MDSICYPRPNSIDPEEDCIIINRAPHAGGTSLMGEINTSYQTLVDVFGPPTFVEHSENGTYAGGWQKVNCEWDLYIDGEIVTIYSYKDNRVPRNITDWHIGGRHVRAEKLVRETLQAYREWKKSGVPRLTMN